MLLIAASFILIFLFATFYGVAGLKVLGIKTAHPVIVSISGLCFIMFLATTYSFFGRLGWVFEGGMLGMAISFAFLFRRKFEGCAQDYGRMFKRWSWYTRAIGIVLLISILMQCAAAPILPDNDSYYVQTIKWMDEYGTVPGLANLHMFLSQGSGWHYAQAALNFNGIIDRLNDLSGFILLLGGVWSLDKLNNFLTGRRKDWLDLAAGLFLLPMPFYAQFIGAPSPDIPVYIISVLVFHGFVKLWRKPSNNRFLWMCLLVISAVFIKATCVVLALFPAIVLIKNFGNYRRCMRVISVTALMAGSLFLLKNYFLTGYLFFPFVEPDLVSPEWQWPKDVADYFTHLGAIYAFELTPTAFQSMTAWEVFIHWITLPGIDGFLNKVLIATSVILPLILLVLPKSRFREKKLAGVIYIVFLVHAVLMMLTSPQFRFYFNLLAVVYLCIGAFLLQKVPKLAQSTLAIAVCLPIGFLFYAPFSGSEESEFAMIPASFHISQIAVPHPETRFPSGKHEQVSYQGFEHYPPGYDFFYGTGDAPLPAVNTEMLEYLYQNFSIIPRKRSDDMGDGFISHRVKVDSLTNHPRR